MVQHAAQVHHLGSPNTHEILAHLGAPAAILYTAAVLYTSITGDQWFPGWAVPFWGTSPPHRHQLQAHGTPTLQCFSQHKCLTKTPSPRINGLQCESNERPAHQQQQPHLSLLHRTPTVLGRKGGPDNNNHTKTPMTATP